MFNKLFQSNKQTNPFEDFLKKHGTNPEVELIDGALVERMPPHMEAEKLRVWLQWLLADYLKAIEGGILIDSTIPIAITTRRARRASLAYINSENVGILRNNAAYGVPDLVIDILSPHALASDLSVREGDYRTIEVPEIIFLDPVRHTARVLRRRGREYEEERLIETATLQLAMLDSIAIPMSALMREPRPPVNEMLNKLLNG
jgi:Uma2 family endonuclease